MKVDRPVVERDEDCPARILAAHLLEELSEDTHCDMTAVHVEHLAG